MNKKAVILIVTFIFAAAAIFFAAWSYLKTINATYTGTVVDTKIVYSDNQSDVEKLIVTVQGEERRYVFEFNKNTTVIDTDGNKTTFYYVKLGSSLTLTYDKRTTAADPAQYIAKKVKITEIREDYRG